MHLFRKYVDLGKASRWKRWRTIFDMLEDRHVVPIADIIDATKAKSAVIEKDIETLSARGLVMRTAKGGLTMERFHGEKSFEERCAEDPLDKARIAKMAAEKYIHPEMVLFLDGSSTVTAILEHILDLDLTIVTNSLYVVDQLRKGRFVGETHCAGGFFRPRANTVVGESACEFFSGFKADMSILGVEGISSKLELMEAHPGEAMVKQSMMRNAARTIVLAMPSKLNDDSLLTFGTLEEVEALISLWFPKGAFTDGAMKARTRLECPATSLA